MSAVLGIIDTRLMFLQGMSDFSGEPLPSRISNAEVNFCSQLSEISLWLATAVIFDFDFSPLSCLFEVRPSLLLPVDSSHIACVNRHSPRQFDEAVTIL